MASSQSQKTTSLKSLILKYKDQLDISELDYLMALTLHKNIEYVYKNPDKALNRSNILAFKRLVNKRLENWSLAKLKKQKEFFKLNFLVNRHTLIPRPESELLVEEALKITSDNQNIIDIGTGSGALILSLAYNNKHHANYLACDISLKALRVAKSNARKLGLKNKVKFVKSDLLKNIEGKFDIIIANLPYLTNEQMKEPSISKEPSSALVSGKDGLNHYRKLLKQLPKHLNNKYTILLEIDPGQADVIKREITDNLPNSEIKFLKDLNKDIRVVKINKSI